MNVIYYRLKTLKKTIETLFKKQYDMIMEKGSKIYLDNCAYNRPFDDKEQLTVNTEHFDYTKWQQDLWKDKTIDEIHQAATDHYISNHGSKSVKFLIG
jgi:hypothetical protein